MIHLMIDILKTSAYHRGCSWVSVLTVGTPNAHFSIRVLIRCHIVMVRLQTPILAYRCSWDDCFDGLGLQTYFLRWRRPSPAEDAETPALRATYYTPELTDVKFHWNALANVHWTIPVKVHRKSDSPLENATDNPLEKAEPCGRRRDPSSPPRRAHFSNEDPAK